jgi:hypothetical protein
MTFTTIISEGNLIPADLLERVAAGEAEGQSPADFGFEKARRLGDEIAAAWGDVRAYWESFQRRIETQARQGRLRPDDPATSLTREFWVVPLLETLGYNLTYTPSAAVVGGRTYALSHRAGADEHGPPVHIEGLRRPLDQKVKGGTRLSPHALLQEYLNNTEQLWGIVTNGERLRLLRDSSRTTRPSYVEFDLRAMLEGEQFAEWALLYRLLHRTRLPQGVEDGPRCLLERYHQQALEAGGRVREGLRDGVEAALKLLGNGLLAHPANDALRAALHNGSLSAAEYYRQLLRLVYRLLFLMVAEERNLLSGDPAGLATYRAHYSVGRLRRLAEQSGAARGRHGDLWLGLLATFRLLQDDEGAQALGLVALDGDLFGPDAVPHLHHTRMLNSALLRAVRALSLYRDKTSKALRRVNYGALDVEELGSVYESLLDYRPVVTGTAFDLVTGTERKTTGSYYTRPELVHELIKSALEPVLEQRLKDAGPDSAAREAAILGITVCDPACGSGHFLLAAARRLGRELARVRSGEDQPAPEAFRRAVRDVVARCIYGVDANPLAVDLCKVALWIEGLSTGLPLNFLDSHIRWGNSLVGATHALVAGGIPDDAYAPVTGDDKAAASAFRKRNAKERKANEAGQAMLPLWDEQRPYDAVLDAARALDTAPDASVAAVRAKARAFAQLRERDSAWYDEWTRFNLWTAAFFTPLRAADDPAVPTTQALLDWERNPGSVHGQLAGHANALAIELGFFHWELEFPQVFEGTRQKVKDKTPDGDVPAAFAGGFDVVLGNPPWEQVELQEQEHWVDEPYIAKAANKAERERRIKEYRTSDDTRKQARVAQFDGAKYAAEAESRFVRASRRFPLTAVGRVNTYALFAEHAHDLLKLEGRAGIIVPTGIATDDTYKDFIGTLSEQQQLISLYDFENRENIFHGVGHGVFKFCLATIGAAKVDPQLVFFATNIRHLADKQRTFSLSSEDILLINPNTRTYPVFRTAADAELTKKIYHRVPPLLKELNNENKWGVSYRQGLFNMATDSYLFCNYPNESLLPLYEAKMFWHFDHRFGNYTDYPEGAETSALPKVSPERLQNPHYTVKPRYWVERSNVEVRLGQRNWQRNWILAFRDITKVQNERTAIFSLLPRMGVGHTAPLMFLEKANTLLYICFLAITNSLVFDFIARQKIGGTHLTFTILNQLPVLPPDAFSEADIAYIVPRVLELVYTAWDMQPFAEANEPLRAEIVRRNAECNEGADPALFAPPQSKAGSEHNQQPATSNASAASNQQSSFNLPPFKWNDERRAHIRAELDARIARLYGLTRDELRYILDPADVYGPEFPGETFRVLKEKETRLYGEYRTRRLVLAAWDEEEEQQK